MRNTCKLSFINNIHLSFELLFFFRATTDEETLEMSRMLLSSPDSYRQLVDFDNHFDDVSKDWRNLQIGEFIQRST